MCLSLQIRQSVNRRRRGDVGIGHRLRRVGREIHIHHLRGHAVHGEAADILRIVARSVLHRRAIVNVSEAERRDAEAGKALQLARIDDAVAVRILPHPEFAEIRCSRVRVDQQRRRAKTRRSGRGEGASAAKPFGAISPFGIVV